jgi:hypothetical protein
VKADHDALMEEGEIMNDLLAIVWRSLHGEEAWTFNCSSLELR